MTTDTSRPAVEALIAELGPLIPADREGGVNAQRYRRIQKVLAALLDERDAARGSSVWRDTIDEQRAYIRDLEATNRKISERSANHHDNAIKWRRRAERAEAELLHARGISEIRGAERDRLKSRADNSLRAVRDVAAKLDAVKAEVRRYRVIPGDVSQPAPSYYVHVGQQVVADRVVAILADTDEEPSRVD